MELLGERPVWSMSGGEMLSTLDALDAELAQLEAYRLQVIAGIDATGYAQELGARDTAELLAFRYRMDRPQAHRDVKLARALPKYGSVSTALTHGIIPLDSAADTGASATGEQDIDTPDGADACVDGPEPLHDQSADHARLFRPAQAGAIVSALERVRSRVPVEHLEVAEAQLVTLAGHLSPSELRRAAKQICDLLDSDGPEPDEQKAYARESLTMANADNGVTFRGYLANENAELLRSLVHAGARPHRTIDGELDPRPRDKRQADALTSVLTIAAAATDTGFKVRATETSAAHHSSQPTDGSDTGTGTATQATNPTAAAGDPATSITDRAARASGWVPGFGAKANITVTIDLEDLKRATADATGDLVYGDRLSAATIRRLACDAKIIPLVLGSHSEPLDVGRAERLVTPGMRRALNARDKGCVICGAPPIQCDAHHLDSWINGGLTAIHNLALLCRRHHVDLHHGNWTITITNGVVHVARPTWADPPPPRLALSTQQPAPPRRTTTPTPATPTTTPAASSTTPADPAIAAPREPEPIPKTTPTPAPATASVTEAGVQVPPALVAAATALGSASRRTTTGAELLQRLLAAKGESTSPIAASSLREAATLAIWGEPSTPLDRPVTIESTTSPGDPRLDPYGDQPSSPWPELDDDHSSNELRKTAITLEPTQ